MAETKVILPAMGEGIFEATITQWMINVGDAIEEDDSLVEIATDKVDSEIPSPVSGKLSKILVNAGEIAKIGQELAIIVSGDEDFVEDALQIADASILLSETDTIEPQDLPAAFYIDTSSNKPSIPFKLNNGKFLSPLVRSIASKEGVTLNDLEKIDGTGLNGRLTKDDIVNYLKPSNNLKGIEKDLPNSPTTEKIEIVEMDRMRKLIADHMVLSKQTSPHVTSFHEVDVTNIVTWREKYKDEFYKRYNQKITYTPIFIDAVVRAIKKHPNINVSVKGYSILLKKEVNVGMATALPSGNLIVPVIHKADELSLSGLAAKVNDLASRARNSKLQPAEIQGGTFTITNVGTFGNLSGTPIINQPEAAILAIGVIKKRPAVIETVHGDSIGIRHQMILSLSYDHRIIDGSLGGMFLKQVADNMEGFDGSKWL